MAENKTRKVLTETDLLSIVESTESELLAAEAGLAGTVDKHLDGIFPAGTFEHLVKSGIYQASTVTVKDQPAFVMIHTRNALGWLVIEGAVRIGKLPLRHLFDGGDALARHLRAPQLVFVTKLSSLFKFASGRGWKSLGVILCKEVSE